MGRKAKIDKNMILEAAFELLDEGGIENVAIKSIAAKLNCSTQPISWHFGSMVELKKELFDYAGMKMFESLDKKMEGRAATEAFFISGIHYISIACDHPQVFRFLSVDNTEKTIGIKDEDKPSIFTGTFDEGAVKILSKQYNIPEQTIIQTVRDVVIYTHGLAVLMMFDNYKMPKEKACHMVYDMGVKLLKDIGISADYTFDSDTIANFC
ncbi:MAG: TetR/AcrR family transcriptional regulator [Clostridiales bacterium]|nr:TetR/AcrR family transcriptional regulator [Clostridiales bacterium]